MTDDEYKSVSGLANSFFQALRMTTTSPAEASAVICIVMANLICVGRSPGVSTEQAFETTMNVVKSAVGRIEAEQKE